jgi:hypothetical protein
MSEVDKNNSGAIDYSGKEIDKSNNRICNCNNRSTEYAFKESA